MQVIDELMRSSAEAEDCFATLGNLRPGALREVRKAAVPTGVSLVAVRLNDDLPDGVARRFCFARLPGARRAPR